MTVCQIFLNVYNTFKKPEILTHKIHSVGLNQKDEKYRTHSMKFNARVALEVLNDTKMLAYMQFGIT